MCQCHSFQFPARIWVRYSLFAGVMDVQHRLPELVGKFQSQLGSAAEHALKRLALGCVV